MQSFFRPTPTTCKADKFYVNRPINELFDEDKLKPGVRVITKDLKVRTIKSVTSNFGWGYIIQFVDNISVLYTKNEFIELFFDESLDGHVDESHTTTSQIGGDNDSDRLLKMDYRVKKLKELYETMSKQVDMLEIKLETLNKKFSKYL